MAYSSVTGGRPGMPSGAAAFMAGSAASLAGGVQSSMSINGPMGAGAFPGSSSCDYGWPPGQVGTIPAGMGMPPAMPGTIAPTMAYGSNSYMGTSPYLSSMGMPMGSMAPPGAPGLPVTPAYQQAAAAMGTKVLSGPGFDGMTNPFEGASASGWAPVADVYREKYGNDEVTVQTLQSLEATGKTVPDSYSAQMPSQYMGMAASGFAGSSEAVQLSLDCGPSQSYGWSGASVPLPPPEENGYSTSMQQYGQMSGALDGPSYPGAAAAAQYGAGYGSSSYSGAGGGLAVANAAAAEALRATQKQDDNSFNFPTSGSFVAAPYDDAGVPTAYGGPPNYDAPAPYASGDRQAELRTDMPPSSEARAGRSLDPYEEEVRRSMANNSLLGGAAKSPYDSYSGGSMGPAPNGYDNPGGGIRGTPNIYDGSAGGMRKSVGDYRGGPDYGPPSQLSRGGPDYGPQSQLYNNGTSYGGVPPAGNVSNASIGAQPLDPYGSGRQAAVGSVLATSGSFVASPFAEGAPSFDSMLPPSNSYTPPPMAYAPPAMPYNGLQTSGSFVAAPFAEGAPTPDMFGMSMAPRMPGGSPDSYGSMAPPASLGMYGGPDSYGGMVPPASLGMYGGSSASAGMGMGMGMGMGGGGPMGMGPGGPMGGAGAFDMGAGGPMGGAGAFGGGSAFGYGAQSPFVGFDAEVPGKSMASGNFGDFGMGPQAGSFVAMPPPPGKEAAGVRFSDKKDDHPGKDAQPRGNKHPGEKASQDDAAKHKDRMPRGSRDRDTSAPRTKRKAERRACC